MGLEGGPRKRRKGRGYGGCGAVCDEGDHAAAAACTGELGAERAGGAGRMDGRIEAGGGDTER
jgi:hypothetical protein